MAHRQFIFEALAELDRWDEVSARLVSRLTPYQLLLHVLDSGLLGREFSSEEIAHMLYPRHSNMSQAVQNINRSMSRVRRLCRHA